VKVDESSDSHKPFASSSWTELIEQIKRNDTNGFEELNRIFFRGVRFYLCRQLGHRDLDEQARDTLVAVAQSIQRGELPEADRLAGFVCTMVRRQVAEQIERDRLLAAHAECGPEQSAAQGEKRQTAREVLMSTAAADREILIRFYLREQTAEQICRETGLTETEFQSVKSRAKARLKEFGPR